MTSKICTQGLAHWQTIKGDRKAPLRTDFDPIDVPKLLTHLVFFDVLEGGKDFQFRVIGTTARSFFYEDWTGRRVSSLPHVEPEGTLITFLRRVVETSEPVTEMIEYVGPESKIKKNGELLLPLTDEAGNVTHIVAYLDLRQQPRNRTN